MKVTVTEKSASERTLEVIVDAQQVESAFQKAFKKTLKQFALPGFRKGKVPQAMAERYITDEALVRDVVGELVPKAFEQAVKEQNLAPISQPDWNLIQNERGKDLVFKASFIVTPVLKITGYEGMAIEQEREEIGDSHIDDTLQRMLEQQAEMVELTEDRGLQEGDHATVDYASFQNGQATENGSVTNFSMEMKPENYIDGFVSNLLGARAGEEREFEIEFPKDYDNADLAGEKVSFQFKIHDIKVKRLPELDDEFAKSHSEHETLASLKTAVRERLEAGVKNQADQQAVTTIVKNLMEQVPEDVIPAQLRQHQAQKAIRARMYELAQRGVSLEQLLAARGMTQDMWIQEMMAAGVFEARLEVLYRSIAQAEGVKVDDQEIDNVIRMEAGSYKMKPHQLRKQMEKNGTFEMLEYSLLTEKLHTLLKEKAQIDYVAPGTAKAEKATESKKASKPKKAKAKDSESDDTAESNVAVAAEEAEKPRAKKKSEAPSETEEPKAKATKKPAKKSSKKKAD